MKSKLIAFIGILAAVAMSTNGWALLRTTAGAAKITLNGDPSSWAKYYTIDFYEPVAYNRPNPENPKEMLPSLETRICHPDFTTAASSFAFYSGAPRDACKTGNLSKIVFKGKNNADTFTVTITNWQSRPADDVLTCGFTLKLQGVGTGPLTTSWTDPTGNCTISK